MHNILHTHRKMISIRIISGRVWTPDLCRHTLVLVSIAAAICLKVAWIVLVS